MHGTRVAEDHLTDVIQYGSTYSVLRSQLRPHGQFERRSAATRAETAFVHRRGQRTHEARMAEETEQTSGAVVTAAEQPGRPFADVLRLPRTQLRLRLRHDDDRL